MGRANRIKPARLAAKLQSIRKSLDLTMEQMIAKLDCKHIPLYPASIAEYEKGKREPPLPVLLQYARAVNVYVDVLIDDALDLPADLPCRKPSMGVKRSAK
jgi:transcriptional regulator with XRE-family HTH domain